MTRDDEADEFPTIPPHTSLEAVGAAYESYDLINRLCESEHPSDLVFVAMVDTLSLGRDWLDRI